MADSRFADHAVTAYIGIGSNLQNPVARVRQALQDLETLPGTRCVTHSPLYRSKPVGPAEQPDYINAVARLQTKLTAKALLEALQTIEKAHGRTRTLRWGPRTLDLDILLYGDLISSDPHLILPHPRLQERPFVLYPLYDIATDLRVPGLGMLENLVRNCPPTGLERLAGGNSSLFSSP